MNGRADANDLPSDERRRADTPLRLVLVIVSLVAMAGSAAGADIGASRLEVDYRPPRLSVEAGGHTVAQIVAAIGARVGFEVVDAGTPSAPVIVTFSIRDSAVDDVLRQLLRGVNHTVLYLEAGNTSVIGKIVLLGTPSPVPPSLAATAGQPDRGALERSNPLLSRDPGPNVHPAADPSTTPTTVADLLKARAGSAGQITDMHSWADGPPSDPTGADPLADTTRRAQRDLATLVSGLAAASRALQNSLAAAPR